MGNDEEYGKVVISGAAAGAAESTSEQLCSCLFECISFDMNISTLKDGIIRCSKLNGQEQLSQNDRLLIIQHKQKNTKAKFYQIETHTGKFIELTANHYLYTKEKQWVEAKYIQVGNRLINEQSELETVIAIKKVVKKGIICPISKSGILYVNGLKASSYSSLGIFSHNFCHYFIVFIYYLASLFGISEQQIQEWNDLLFQNDK